MNREEEEKIVGSQGLNGEVTPSIPVVAEKSNDSHEKKRADYERSKKIALRKYGL